MAISTTQLEQLYLAYFGRPADFDGLVFYTSNPAFDLWSVAAAFSASPESQALYGSGFGAAQINAIYQNLFNRDAEPAGLLYWATEVASGRLTAAGAAYGILIGAQNDDLVAVNNKMAVSAAFTAELNTTAEIAGYSGNAAAAAARAFLHTVDSTAASVAAAMAGLEAAVTGVTTQPVVGVTVELTTGVDTLVGTDANDTFNAYAVLPSTGAAATTLQSVDKLDGGAGTDTLNIYVSGSQNSQQVGSVKNIEIVNINNTEATTLFGSNVGDGQFVDASKFVGATQIWQIGQATDVYKLGASTTAGFDGVELNGQFIEAAATAASVSVALKDVVGEVSWDGAESDSDGVSIYGAAVSKVTISGGAAVGKAGDVTDSGTLINDQTSRVDVEIGTDAKSLAIIAASAIDLSVYGESLTSVDASGVAGGVNLWSSQLTSVRTGAGADNVWLYTESAKDNAATTTVETVDVSVDVGAGDDSLGVSAHGNGKTTISAGDGDDEVYLSVETDVTGRSVGAVTVDLGAGDDIFYGNNTLDALLTKSTSTGVGTTSDVKIAGGAGNDMFVTSDSSITAASYERLALNVTGFETIAFEYGAGTSTTAIDASKLAQFTTIALGDNEGTNDSYLTKVSGAQTVEVNSHGVTTHLTAAGFVAEDPATEAVELAFGANMNVVFNADAEANGSLDVRAAALNVTVAATLTADETNYEEDAGSYGSTTSATVASGTVETLNVAIQSVSGTGAYAGDEWLSYFGLAGSNDAITGLKSVAISGQGNVLVDANVVSASTLKIIDVSGMSAMLNLNDDGDQDTGEGLGYQNLSTATIIGNNDVAETIKLGGADDTVFTSSTGAKMDTITGFELVATAAVADAGKVADVAKSDAIIITSSSTGAFTKLTIDSGNSTIALALDQAAKTTADNLIFAFGGDTYIYIDADGFDGAGTTYSSTNDIVIKLAGAYDFDLLSDVVSVVAPIIVPVV